MDPKLTWKEAEAWPIEQVRVGARVRVRVRVRVRIRVWVWVRVSGRVRVGARIRARVTPILHGRVMTRLVNLLEPHP